LRQLFINDRLPEQSALITEYNKLLSTLSVVTYKVA
jgi:hypothetical protein